MIEMKTFWCKGRPTLKDISKAYELVKSEDVAIRIEWFVPYNGMHDRTITVDTLSRYPTPEMFFEEAIPHCYGV